jgi:hypothetical protein
MRVPIAGRISDSSGSGEAKLARRLAGASRGGTSGDPVGHVDPGELAGLGAQRPHVAAQPSVGRSPGAGLAHGLLAAVQEAFTIHQVAPVHTTKELEQSLGVVAWLKAGEDLSDASPRDRSLITVRYHLLRQ